MQLSGRAYSWHMTIPFLVYSAPNIVGGRDPRSFQLSVYSRRLPCGQYSDSFTHREQHISISSVVLLPGIANQRSMKVGWRYYCTEIMLVSWPSQNGRDILTVRMLWWNHVHGILINQGFRFRCKLVLFWGASTRSECGKHSNHKGEKKNTKRELRESQFPKDP